MDALMGLIVFVVIWWLVLFFTLHRPWPVARKLATTTALAAVAWGVIYGIVESGAITIQG